MAKKIDVKGALIKAAAIGAGAVAAGYLNKISFVGSQKPIVRGIIKIGAGALIPPFLSKGKSGAFVEGVGNGMMGIGAAEIANSFLPAGSQISISGFPVLPMQPSVTAMYPSDATPITVTKSSGRYKYGS